jgi:hypothetical protein
MVLSVAVPEELVAIGVCGMGNRMLVDAIGLSKRRLLISDRRSVSRSAKD